MTEIEGTFVSPKREVGAYEALWAERSMTTFKKIHERLLAANAERPSEIISEEASDKAYAIARALLAKGGVEHFGVRVQGTADYPDKLKDAEHPLALFYYQGWWDLVFTRSVAIVGTRKPSDDGVKRAQKLVRWLVEKRFTIVSGLAAGIDTVVHKTAIESGGNTIAVIGTPLSEIYPKENAKLQQEIADRFLIVSQVPVCRYSMQDYRMNRLFFPERNKTMSALTDATIIVEAGETSGTLIQAKAALKQGRKLFILNSCFENPAITWPAKFAKEGAVRVRTFEDIERVLKPVTLQ